VSAPWFSSAATFPPLVLGLRLKPLTLDHVFFLHELASPFVTGQPVSIPDFFLAVFICSEPAAETRRDIGRWWFPRFVKLWTWKCRKVNIRAEVELFRDYLEAFQKMPQSKRRLDVQETPLVSPWPYRVLAILMGELGLSHADSMREPLSHLLCLLAAHRELKGDLTLWSEQDEEVWAAVNAAREAEKAKA
jgi:hypothetical protein